MNRLLGVVALLLALSGLSYAASCDNIAKCTIEPAGAVTAGAQGWVFAVTTVSATDSATVGCTDTTAVVAGATTSMTVLVSPQGAPLGAGAGNITWAGYATAGNVVVRLCTTVAVTAAATVYNVVVLN
jgi:hypothetical protein